MTTKIEWAGDSWNPIKASSGDKTGWHCVKVSTECANCYAEAMNRWRGTGLPYNEPSIPELYLDENAFLQPFHWRKYRRVFVCSMTDLFADFVPEGWLHRIFAVMAACPNMDFLVLTKRSERAARLLTDDLFAVNVRIVAKREGWLKDMIHWPLPNVWAGFSAGNQTLFDARWHHMQHIAAAGWLTWCSAEPLLDPITFGSALEPGGLQWGVVGGESGRKSRVCDIGGIRSCVCEFESVGLPLVVKQLGRRPVGSWNDLPLPVGSESGWHLKDDKGGDMTEWPRDLQGRRSYPVTAASTRQKELQCQA